ncbi:hypothetical protein PHLGIDRAFT_116398 [Phlebiopsis gigantea 11061_1 CR5-6]|uniref:ubiquitinyl hydrolase 1 n=1 Tax=Phlebiopsis gigantea (strain 11061_1 CR5-6) TaxID=745531 RepID=A0A0C3S2E6_PHLG1|nr:hypothetical protein PHLGIDRAFT_116398 [Phlebiopsis gigantea 11061_1 CR5-6]
MNTNNATPPPPPPRMKASDLPDISKEPPLRETTSSHNASEQLPGYSITTSDSDLATLPPSQLFELNQAAIDDAAQSPNIPLIGVLTKLEDLREEYIRGNQTFVKQINYLGQKNFLGIRRTRGDGDCFYRSFSFAYIERLLKSSPDVRWFLVEDALAKLSGTKSLLKRAGYEEAVFEDFYEEIELLLKRILNKASTAPPLTQRGLLDAFNDAPVSNSITVYMRYITAAEIKTSPNYAPFLFNPDFGNEMDAIEFCNCFVDPIGVEADQVQITALTTALQVDLDVAYLDGHEHPFPSGIQAQPDMSYVNVHQFENGDGFRPIVLLYRPGHYDVLSEMSADPQEGLF